MQTFLTICLFATFIATGESLLCENCWDFGHTCEGPLEDCPFDEDTCGTKQIRTSGMLEIEFTEKSCFHSRECNKSLESIDFGLTGQLLTKTTCCMGKECEKVIPPLPPVDTNPNGKKCPACYSVNKLDCKGVVAECTGDNIYCTALSGNRNYENWTVPFALKGCTNRDVCKDIDEGSSSDLFTIDRCVTSSGPPIAIPESSLLFLQTISELLLLKILV